MTVDYEVAVVVPVTTVEFDATSSESMFDLGFSTLLSMCLMKSLGRSALR